MNRGLALGSTVLFLMILLTGPSFGAGPSCPPVLASPALQYDRLEIPEIDENAETSPESGAPLIEASDPLLPPETSSAAFLTEGKSAAVLFESTSPFTPYLGAGIGPAGKGSATDLPDSAPPENLEETSAFLFKAGVACELQRGTELNLGYRYVTGNLPELAAPLGLTTDPASNDHHISLDLKLAF